MRDKVTIAIIGAGSVVFSKGTIGDILLSDVLTRYPIDLRLMDIMPERLAGVEQFATGSAAKARQAADGYCDDGPAGRGGRRRFCGHRL